jgi:N-acyl-D-amino-acid deacylase
VLTLEEAIRRITSLPAERLELAARGRLKVGAAADVVVLDPAEVRDNATLKRPKQHPAGFQYVMLDGVFTLREGMRTAHNP